MAQEPQTVPADVVGGGFGRHDGIGTSSDAITPHINQVSSAPLDHQLQLGKGDSSVDDMTRYQKDRTLLTSRRCAGVAPQAGIATMQT